MVEFRTLGSLDLKGEDGRQLHALLAQPKRIALLTYLAVATPRGFHRRDTLLALFWPDLDQERARQALRQALHVLRRTLGPEVILARGDDEIAVDRARLWCDAVEINEALDAGADEKGLELYRGDFLEGFFLSNVPEFERWVDGVRTRLRARAAKAALHVAEQEAAAGHAVEAAHWARRASALAIDDEASLRRLIALLHRVGDRAGALRAHDEFARRMAREYEAEPSAETQALMRTVRGEARPNAGLEAPRPAPIATVAPSVATPPDAVAPASVPARRPRLWRAAVFAAVLIAAIAAVFIVRSARRGPVEAVADTAPSAPDDYLGSVAVLPFANLGGRPEDEYLSEGITDEIIGRLAGIGRLKVISRTSVVALKGRALTVPQVADTLGVRHMVEGSVRRSGNRIRVTVQLIDAESDAHLWTELYDRELRDVFAIQTDVALRIVSALKGTLIAADSARFERKPTQDLEAYSAYLKGRYFWNRRTDADLRRALALFQEAVARDPGYALAHAGLADTYIILGNFRLLPPNEAYSKAKTAALKALEIQGDLAEALVALAFVEFLHDWDWPGAARDFERALTLNPNYAVGHQWYAVYLAAMKRPAEATAEIQRAAELDPLSLTINAVTAWIALLGRRYDLAAANARRTLELDPNFPLAYYYLGQAEAHLRRPARAVAALRTLVRLDSTPRSFAELAWASAVAGQRERAVAILNRLEASSREQYISPLDIAQIHAALGNVDDAFRWLERAYELRDPWLVLLEVNAKLDVLRADTRLESLTRRMDFPE